MVVLSFAVDDSLVDPIVEVDNCAVVPMKLFNVVFSVEIVGKSVCNDDK
jgi:hypothetical protein